jgi:hypothetical protein
MRKASVARDTTETKISATVNLDGSGRYDIETGIGFLDHMLEQLSRHSLIDITLSAKGDLHIDFHHTTPRIPGSSSARPWPRPWASARESPATAMRSSPWTRP